MNDSIPGYYKYWGKADNEGNYHLLPYHCLDVAAVGMVWLELDSVLRTRIAYAIGMDKDDPSLAASINFFLALHDFGKFDIRFQSKVPQLRNRIWNNLNLNDLALSQSNITEFDHGKAGYDIFVKFYTQLLKLAESDYELLDKWIPWVAAVTGHHGVIPLSADWQPPNVEKHVIEQDKNARIEWSQKLIQLFLKDYHNLLEIPELSSESIFFLAGFCSIADWIASNELFVRWVDRVQSIKDYFEGAKEHCRSTAILSKTGLIDFR
jgi:CRISPR-associated endonuclease/helicase Cas3